MKILKFLTLGCIVSLLFMNMDCNKNDECEVITQAPQEFLDYWFFPVGSWWVYRNKDGEFDTVTCILKDSIYYKPNDNYGLFPCIYYYNCTFKHTNQEYYPSDYHYIYSRYNNPTYQNGKWLLVAEGGNGYYFLNFFFRYQPKLMDTVNYYTVSNKVRLTQITDTNVININGKTFYSTVGISNFHEGDKPDLLYENIWITKEIGIVKISYYNGNYWELIDYKINK